MLNIQEVYEQYFTVVYRYLLSLSHNTHIAEEVFGELSFGTISSLFSKSESWARVTYHRACKKIREELNHEDQL